MGATLPPAYCADLPTPDCRYVTGHSFRRFTVPLHYVYAFLPIVWTFTQRAYRYVYRFTVRVFVRVPALHYRLRRSPLLPTCLPSPYHTRYHTTGYYLPLVTVVGGGRLFRWALHHRCTLCWFAYCRDVRYTITVSACRSRYHARLISLPVRSRYLPSLTLLCGRLFLPLFVAVTCLTLDSLPVMGVPLPCGCCCFILTLLLN